MDTIQSQIFVTIEDAAGEKHLTAAIEFFNENPANTAFRVAKAIKCIEATNLTDRFVASDSNGLYISAELKAKLNQTLYSITPDFQPEDAPVDIIFWSKGQYDPLFEAGYLFTPRNIRDTCFTNDDFVSSKAFINISKDGEISYGITNSDFDNSLSISEYIKQEKIAFSEELSKETVTSVENQTKKLSCKEIIELANVAYPELPYTLATDNELLDLLDDIRAEYYKNDNLFYKCICNAKLSVPENPCSPIEVNMVFYPREQREITDYDQGPFQMDKTIHFEVSEPTAESFAESCGEKCADVLAADSSAETLVFELSEVMQSYLAISNFLKIDSEQER